MKRKDIDLTIRLHMETTRRTVTKVLDVEGLARFERTATIAGELLKSYYRESDRIDKEVAVDLRLAQKVEAARSTYAVLEQWREENLAPLHQRIDAGRRRALAELNGRRAAKVVAAVTRATAAGATDASFQIRREMQQREIRDRLQGLDSTQIEAIYLTADELVREAIESGPPRLHVGEGGPRLTPFMAPEKIEAILQTQALEEAPGIVAEINELDAMQMTYTQVFAAVKAGIKDEALMADLSAPAGSKPTQPNYAIEIR